MKKSKNELNVDFIGGLQALTKVEEKALSIFFKQKKDLAKKRIPKSRQQSLKKEVVLN